MGFNTEWDNINKTPGEQMDLVIVKLEILSKNILYIPNNLLYAIFSAVNIHTHVKLLT